MRESYKISIRDLHKGDRITEQVAHMVENMLDTPEGRPTANQLWRTQLRILEDAKHELSARDQRISSSQSPPSRGATMSGPKLPPKAAA